MPASELAYRIWDGSPSGESLNALHVLVTRVRRQLGPELGARIVTEPGGYRINVADDELDLARYFALLARGRAEASALRGAQACDALTQALAEWRGEPLMDIPCSAVQQEDVPTLRESRLQALQDRIEAELNLGRHAQIIDEVQRLASPHPLHERFHGQLMLALHRAGRPADALAAYRAARRRLSDELGVDPGPELRRPHQRILTADPALAVVVPGHGRGVEYVPPRQLPAAVGHFVGRKAELKALRKAAGRGGSVVIAAISGTAGVGKTALAVRFAHEVAHRFPDGQLYVNLRSFDSSGAPSDPLTVVRGFLAALGVKPAGMPAAGAEHCGLQGGHAPRDHTARRGRATGRGAAAPGPAVPVSAG